jgi:glucose-1-phosphate adenylyltransferase
VFSRDVLFRVLDEHAGHVDFGREVIPGALTRYRVRPWIYRGYWADVGTIGSFYDANVGLTGPQPSFSFYDPTRPIYTRPRFLPSSRFAGCDIRDSLIAEGCYLRDCKIQKSVVGIRMRIGCDTTITRSVLLGADFYEEAPGARTATTPALGIGRNVVLDRVIVDKNARIGDDVRLVNARLVEHADGEGWYIRDGVIVVPKGATIPSGTVV